MSTATQSNELVVEIQNTADNLLQTLAAYNETAINLVPPQGGWTAGQVSEHLLKSCSPEGLYASTHKTERAVDEKIGMIKGIFLDFDAKYTSPEFIRPSTGTTYHKETLVHALANNWTIIEKAAETLDLTETIDFDLPGFGKLTRLETIYLMVYHTQRHTRQLKQIAAGLKNQQAE